MRRSSLFSSTVFPLVAAFANTHAGGKLYVCATAQQADLDQAGYEALVWVQVKGVGSHGETGMSTNILTYDTWDSDVVQKGKGLGNAGDPEVELSRLPTDPGQILLRAMAETNLNYAFKTELNDKNTPTGTGTVRYNRGLVAGPRQPNGRNEDFDLEVFTLALQQKQITVNPTSAGNPPVLTVPPAITGTAEVDEVLTSDTGTFTGDAVIARTYQWFAGGVMIPGAVANTFVVTSAQLGKVITVRVTGTNAAGSAFGFSDPTAAVA
jgi:hypothetical protein